MTDSDETDFRLLREGDRIELYDNTHVNPAWRRGTVAKVVPQFPTITVRFDEPWPGARFPIQRTIGPSRAVWPWRRLTLIERVGEL